MSELRPTVLGGGLWSMLLPCPHFCESILILEHQISLQCNQVLAKAPLSAGKYRSERVSRCALRWHPASALNSHLLVRWTIFR